MPAQNITLTAKWNENPADYTDYDIAVAAANAKKAEDNYDKTYTEASRKALDAALAVDVSGKKLSEQGVVDAQTEAINAAVNGLEKMTYNATFYVDGEEYRVVPTKVASRLSPPRLPPSRVTPSPDGLPRSELWALRMFPSTQYSPQAPLLTLSRHT